MRWRPGGPPVPPAWKRYVTRSPMINERSPRRATHPINALLNLAATIAAGRLTAQLAARGACLSIGFLHADKPGRFSLTYDAIEPLRPFTEAKTFAFSLRQTISLKGSNELRIMDNLLATFTQETALSERAIQAAADFALMLIKSPGHPQITDRGQREHSPSDVDWRHDKRRTSLPSTPPARPPTRSIAPVFERSR